MPGILAKLRKAFLGTPEVHPLFAPSSRRGIGTKIAQQYGHPDALVLPDDLQRLFAGEWVLVSSSWISAFRYDERSQLLYTRLNNGKVYGPDPTSPSEMAAIASAPSKGYVINRKWRKNRP